MSSKTKFLLIFFDFLLLPGCGVAWTTYSQTGSQGSGGGSVLVPGGGPLDPTGSGLNAIVNAIAIDSQGRLIVGGGFTSYNGTSEPYVARLSQGGSLDTSFAPIGTGLNALVYAVAVDNFGKIIVGGNFTTYNGTSAPYVARLNPDGSLDNTFAPTGTGLNGAVLSLAVDSLNRVIVGGYMSQYNGTSEPSIARLNSNGSLDGTFAPTGTGLGGASPSVTAIAIDSLGRLVIAGGFTNYNGTSEPYVARLNTNGSLDGTFGPTGGGLSSATDAIAIDGSGNTVIGGGFGFYNGTAVDSIARLNAAGGLDGTFGPTGSGFSNWVYALAIDSSGKIVVGGNFTSYNGTSEPYIARLNTNGSLDMAFAPTGTGFNSHVQAVVVDSSGEIDVGGAFTSYNGISEPRVARIKTDGSLDF